jgi:hypothetical protein
MALVSLKIPEKTKDALRQESLPERVEGQAQYPYGLKLCFERDQFEQMPQLKDFVVGQKIAITAEGTVVMVRQSAMQSDKPEQTLELQIENIDCQPLVKKPLEQMTLEEYRKAREGMK